MVRRESVVDGRYPEHDYPEYKVISKAVALLVVKVMMLRCGGHAGFYRESAGREGARSLPPAVGIKIAPPVGWGWIRIHF